MSLGFWQIALIVLLFLLLFGRGRIPQLMGDLAEGIKSFRSGVEYGESESGATEGDDAAMGAVLPDNNGASGDDAEVGTTTAAERGTGRRRAAAEE